MKNRPARIYRSLGDGTAVATDYVKMPDGREVPAPANKMEGRVPLQKLPKECPVITNSQINQNSNQMNFNNPAIVTTETPAGNLSTGRIETGSIAAQLEVLTISISNAESSGGPDQVLLGDGAGNLALAAAYGGVGISSLRSGVTFNGNWGTATQTQLKTLTSMVALDLHGLHMVGYDTSGNPDSSVFTGSFLKTAEASVSGNSAVVKNVPLAQMLKPNNYQSHIREIPGFRFTLDALHGIIVTLAIGKRIDLTFNISAAEKSRIMNKISYGV